MLPATTSARKAPVRETANDRLKRRFADLYWGSLIVATLVHVAVFLAAPSIGVADGMAADDDPTAVITLPDIDIPQPPERLRMPAPPVVGAPDAPDAETVPTTDWTERPDVLPPPTRDDVVGAASEFVPRAVAPRLENPGEVRRALARAYPPLLRDAGVGGKAYVRLWIDTEGAVVRAEIARSSGRRAFDAAALDVADLMRFSPAINRDRAVGVIAEVPIEFRVR